VDLIVERKGTRSIYEIKFSQTPKPHMASALVQFAKEYGCKRASVLCLRQDTLPLNDQVNAVHWYTGLILDPD